MPNFLQPRILAVTAAAIIAHVLLFRSGSPLAQSGAAFVLLIAAPGLLLTSLILRDARHALPLAAWLSYGIGIGFGIATMMILGVGLLRGPLSRTVLLGVFDALIAVLLALHWLQRRRQGTTPPERKNSPAPILWAGAVILLLAAGTRLANLGYSQLQGDEATPIVRAAGFAQDHEEAVFLQPRGPLDMVIPAGVMVLVDDDTELALRLPFALASVTVVLAVFSLGAALAGAQVGWAAALLFALDGYAIAFGRVMHYESVILLVTAAAVLALYKTVTLQRETGAWGRSLMVRHFWIAALLTATGLLAHYDSAITVLVGGYLLFVLWRSGLRLLELLQLLLAPACLVLLLTLPFYVAFVLNPNFGNTFGRYSQSLVADRGLLVNNLIYFAESAGLYYGAIGFYVLAAILWLAALSAFWPRRHRRWAAISSGLVLALPLVLAAQWLFPLPFDITPFWVAAIGAALLLGPGIGVAERLLWIWFGFPFFAAMFLVATPGLHFYVFSVPLALLGGMTLKRLHGVLAALTSPAVAKWLAAAGLFCLVLANTVYVFQFFVNTGEVAMRVKSERRAPWLWPVPTLSSAPLYYGAPYDAGWQKVGALFADKTLQGSYLSNIDRWITDWYTNAAEYCKTEPDYVIIDEFSKPDSGRRLRESLGDNYHLQMTISNNQQPRLLIYGREEAGAVKDIDKEVAGDRSVVEMAKPLLPITPWSGPAALTPAGIRFGDSLEVTGVRVDPPHRTQGQEDRMQAGDTLSVTLAWQLLQQTGHNYKVFLQLIDSSAHKAGQRDTLLACNAGPTTDWDAGDAAAGYYQLRTQRATPPGAYSLIFGVYDAATQELVPAYDAGGNLIGDAAMLREIRIASPE